MSASNFMMCCTCNVNLFGPKASDPQSWEGCAPTFMNMNAPQLTHKCFVKEPYENIRGVNGDVPSFIMCCTVNLTNYGSKALRGPLDGATGPLLHTLITQPRSQDLAKANDVEGLQRPVVKHEMVPLLGHSSVDEDF